MEPNKTSMSSKDRPLVSGKKNVRVNEMMLMTAKKKNWKVRQWCERRIEGTHDTTLRELDDHQRSSLGDSKVPSPLCGSGRGQTVMSSSGLVSMPNAREGASLPVVEDLGTDDPRKGTDGEAIRDDEKVDHTSHGDTSRRDRLRVCVGLMSVEDGSDDE